MVCVCGVNQSFIYTGTSTYVYTVMTLNIVQYTFITHIRTDTKQKQQRGEPIEYRSILKWMYLTQTHPTHIWDLFWNCHSSHVKVRKHFSLFACFFFPLLDAGCWVVDVTKCDQTSFSVSTFLSINQPGCVCLVFVHLTNVERTASKQAQAHTQTHIN